MRLSELSLPSRGARWLAVSAAVMVVSIGGTLAGRSQQGPVPLDWLGIALVAAAGGAVAVARRWPIVAFAVALLATTTYLVAGYPSDSPYLLGLLTTAFLVPRPDARLRTLGFCIATLLVLAVGILAAPAIAGTAVALTVLVVSALTAGQLATELSARGERQVAVAREQEARRRMAEERLAIARDLHDVVSHSIALINVQAGVAVHVIDNRPEQARAALLTIKATSHQALDELREILGLLREDGNPPARGPTRGLAALPGLVEEVQAAGVAVRMDARVPTTLPATASMTAYRVVSEALTNVVRHAPGATARVTLEARAGRLMIAVIDDGATPGAAPRDPGSGRGLVGLRERVQAVGGELAAGRRTHGGFAVQAWLPLPEITP